MNFKKLIYMFSTLLIISVISFSFNIISFAETTKHTHIYDNYKTYTCKSCGYTFKKTALRKVNNVWYYYSDGKLDFTETLIKYNGKWYHVKGGKTTKETTLVKYNDKWYHVENGVKPNKTTLFKYKNK